MNEVVLDASAVLALLGNEPGSGAVEDALGSALLSSVNLAEVVSKLSDRGMPEAEWRVVLRLLDVEVRPFESSHALLCATLRRRTRGLGLSLGDRACLALALAERSPVLTADRRWLELDVGIEIRSIR